MQLIASSAKLGIIVLKQVCLNLAITNVLVDISVSKVAPYINL